MQKKIKTWQEAFKAKGLNPSELPDVSNLPIEYQKSTIAQFIMNVVADVLNGDWIPDYTDRDQRKYEPWFEVKADKKNPSGSGLVYGVYVHWYAGTGVGARLCYCDAETAQYAGKKFIKIYEDLFLRRK